MCLMSDDFRTCQRSSVAIIMSEKQMVSGTGRVTRVCAKFAYLTSNNYGCVFLPPCALAATQDGKTSAIPDLMKILRSGDIVHFTALPQRGKNACSFVAVKASISLNTDVYQGLPPSTAGGGDQQQGVLANQMGYIVSVCDTFAFIESPEVGSVFMPGSAYQNKPEEPPRLTVNLKPGDVMMFCARPQSEKSGCRWLALSAARLDVDEEIAAVGSPSSDLVVGGASSYGKPVGVASFADSNTNVIKSGSEEKVVEGVGLVSMVGNWSVVVQHDSLGLVRCGALAWQGGLLYDTAETLTDCLAEGDIVHFVAKANTDDDGDELHCRYKAVSFNPIGLPATPPAESGSSENAYRLVRKNIRATATQTGITAEDLLLPALKSQAPELYEQVAERFPYLTMYADM